MIDDARRQGKRKGLHRGSQMGGHSRWLGRIGIMLLSLTALSVVNVSVTQAEDQPLPTMAVGYQSGKITAVYQTTFQIDGRTYSLTPDAVLLDDSGNEIDAGYIGVQIDAKFHVKKDQNDKIDKMILNLPR